MANYYVTVAGAGSKTGADWANAFGAAEWFSHLASSPASGDKYWLKPGTYTPTGNISAATAGTSSNNVSCIGVLDATTNEPPVATDFADGANRPLISAGAYSLSLPGWWSLRGILQTNSIANGIAIGGGSVVNCEISTTGSSGYALTASYNIQVIDTKLNGNEAGGNGLSLAASSVVSHCQISEMMNYDINMGTGASIVLIRSILNSYECVKLLLGAGNNYIEGNDFYSGDPCIGGGAYGNNAIFNNNFYGTWGGVAFTSTVNQAFFDYNNFYSIPESEHVTNVSKGANTLAVDPGFTSASEYEDADFSISTSSPVVGQGFEMRLGVGA